MAAKSLRPLPVLHKDLSEEARVRQRYVDLIARPAARDMVRLRSGVVRSLRENFYRRSFLEVETPMLQTIASGASARPFSTHMNAYDLELFLRIAPEIFLKKARPHRRPRSRGRRCSVCGRRRARAAPPRR